MAAYKVWLTVKDSYGNVKEIDGGSINIDMSKLSAEDLSKIEQSLTLDEYIKKDNAVEELDPQFATDEELFAATNNTLKYADFELRPNEGSTD